MCFLINYEKKALNEMKLMFWCEIY